MPHLPEISIILPFYNAGNTLKRAMESLVYQSYGNFECILVNNNSSDSSEKVARDQCKNDERFTLIHEKRQGVVFAFNKGLEQANGKYIARMDADDWSYPDRLQHQISYLEKYQEIDAVAGLATYIPHKKETEGFQRYVNWSNEILTYSDIILKQFVESPIINPTAMWRKSVSDQYGSYKTGAFPEDYELWLRWLNKGVKICKINAPLVKWYDSDTRLTRTDPVYSDDSFFKIKTFYLAKWLKKYNPFYPKVLIWGASKISRKRASLLESHGIEIEAFIDITKKRQVGKEIIYYEDLSSPDEVFVLVYLKEETMRAKTMDFLQNRGFMEGKNYLLVS